MGDLRPQETESRSKSETIYTFDDVILERARDKEHVPLIAYPKTRLGITNYELIDGKLLNRLVDGAAKAYIKADVQPVYEDTVVGLFGTSDLDYAITIFALGRLGYTVFILSPRLPVNAIVSLLAGAGASSTCLFHAPQLLSTATKVAREIPLKLLPIATRSQYDIPEDISAPFSRAEVDGEKEALRKLILMHSSGSTGLPRPIHYTHKRLLATILTALDLTAFQSVPLFHAHGFISFIQAIYKRKVIHMFNGNVPQTHDTVTAAIQAANPEIVWTVPYVLKLLAEKRDGIEALKRCKVVSCSGSKCPDELGDLMVKEGIHFGTAFGATEVALILTSLNRPREDKAWNYLRPPPHVAPFIKMKPIDGNICECVVLDGHKGKMMSNSSDPPNSFHTKDLFIAHETIANAWKFVGRLDDRVTLTNGEKVLPLPIEGRILQHDLVREVVVFGVEKPVPGLLLFRAHAAQSLSDEEFLDAVWPAVRDANAHAEGFSQISREMVIVVAEDVECPVTDKSSIKRAQVYRDFKDVIDDVYVRLENNQEGNLELEGPELENWILASFKALGTHLDNSKVDFFSAGVDSLKAIQMRGLIIKSLDLAGNASKVLSMVVYDTGNTEKLAKSLMETRAGTRRGDDGQSEIVEMARLIQQYSVFDKYVDVKTPSNAVLLTGVTGSLGSQLLYELERLPRISKIYCPLRTKSPTQGASERLKEVLAQRKVTIENSDKVIPILADLTKPDFGLSENMLTQIHTETTHIIHCAWEVNFALPISSFAPHFRTLQNLLNFSISSPNKAHLLFCSSVGAAMGTSSNQSSTIAEGPIADLTQASPTGYARSKLIAEYMIENAVKQSRANATILRIGQIIPAIESGYRLWNPNEMIPLMIRSALSTGVLPDRCGSSDLCSWIAVDVLSRTILEIAGLTSHGEEDSLITSHLVYNLVHPRPFSWQDEFLPALKKAGLVFETVERRIWLQKLNNNESDIGKNPSKKLLGFWEAHGNRQKEIVFETAAAERRSNAFKHMPDILAGNSVEELLRAWKEAWSSTKR